jgi:ABC-2 type transport system permease protein
MQNTHPERLPFSTFLSTFGAMVRKELITMARYPVNFIASFANVFIIVTIFTLAGSMFFNAPAGQEALEGSSPGSPSGIVVYGFVLYMFLSDTLWTIGINIRHEQVQGTLEQLYLSPASKFASLVSRVVNTLVWTSLLSLVGGAVMTILIGNLPFENPALGLYLLVMTLTGTFGIGFAFAAFTFTLKETANTVANLAQFAIIVLCGIFFPFSALPQGVIVIARFLPPAYAVDAFRSALMGFPPGFPELAPFAIEFWIVTIFGLLMPFIGYWLYRKAEDSARREGSLSAY